MDFQKVLQFWFEEIDPKSWWVKDPQFDAKLKERFQDLHNKAKVCELSYWRAKPLGRLAEIIVLDQFSRNMFRDTPDSFLQDPLALALAQEAVSQKVDIPFSTQQKMFLYMPYMHSESLLIHKKAQQLFDQPGLENNLDFEMRHYKILERFGRYPHRNEILGRISTPEEVQFLKEPGSSF